MSSQIIHGDCLDVLPTLPASSVDLIATDPPYYRVKGEDWDRQWKTPALFLAWLDRVLAEFARVLKPNGSLYLFASPDMAARVEVLIRQRFEVLNNIRWRKPPFSTKAEMFDKRTCRRYFPTSETVIFAEPFEAEAEARTVFEPLRAYLDAGRLAAAMTRGQIDSAWQRHRQSMGCIAAQWFGRSQWLMPTEGAYAFLRRSIGSEHLPWTYADLRREYERLTAGYEIRRRRFAVSAEVPYTDTWDFATVSAYSGKHPCEKPVPLMEHIIRTSSRPGAVVLDAFCGSGATGEAARNLGRSFIGIEKDATWVERSRLRLSPPAANQPSLFGDAP